LDDCLFWMNVFFLDEWFFGEMFLFFWINVYLYMNVFWRIFVWQFFGQFLRVFWRFFSIILFDLQSFNRWTWKKQGAKNRVILIQKEKRQPGLFFFWLTKTLFFVPCFFQVHILHLIFSGSQTNPCFLNKNSGCRLTGHMDFDCPCLHIELELEN